MINGDESLVGTRVAVGGGAAPIHGHPAAPAASVIVAGANVTTFVPPIVGSGSGGGSA